MLSVLPLYAAFSARLDRLGDWLLPLLARFAFAATLLWYYWSSALTKLGDGPLGVLRPSAGAYAQIFPRQFEAAGYDTEALTPLHDLVVLSGTLAEFALPALIVLGAMTRVSALGMIGFVLIQSLTDVFGHGLGSASGAWFDRMPDGAVLDQRLLWTLLLACLVFKGAGPLSLDALLRRRIN
ncbi:DoxX family protein [Pseudodonghicola flavimaris]|uniref:DoxX family membrane protein n=1 Tax=Pseudodonghicola flavimaris TaxID=3050036 RepID=A0ABT7F0D7_9RHOB|nr:DoxX family membrane protein [Pseudodonghicola flavimaris]MDK3018071.1 DoxX family membrane protein [Pseudodonghicola flavimaris]